MSDHLLLMSSKLTNYLELLPKDCHIHHWHNASDKDALLDEFGDQIRVVGTSGGVGCPIEVIDRLPKLELIASFGVGYDSINVEVAKKRRIAITNTPDVLTDAVAELGLGLMIALARCIPQSDQFVRKGEWLKGNYALTVELSGRTAGIVGLGRIGKELARRLQAMKMRVVYHGRHKQNNELYEYYDDIAAMAAAVDWLILCLPGGGHTNHIVSKDVLKALGSNGYLVNVARGQVVDEAALCQAITSQQIGGAALDVFADEPNVPEELLKAENVVLSPHAASATLKTRRDMGELVIRNILFHLQGRPVLTPVI